MLAQLIQSFREDLTRVGVGQFKLSNPNSKILVHITMQVEELIFSSHQKRFESVRKQAAAESNSEPLGEVNESVFRWIQRDYLSYQLGSDSH